MGGFATTPRWRPSRRPTDRPRVGICRSGGSVAWMPGSAAGFAENDVGSVRACALRIGSSALVPFVRTMLVCARSRRARAPRPAQVDSSPPLTF